MRNSPPIPAWGRWIICIFLGIILGFIILASGIIENLTSAAGSLIGMIFPLVLFALALALYLLPSIVASKSPRLTAILVANIAFGWTGIGWIIVLIWALAESGTLNQKPTPPTP